LPLNVSGTQIILSLTINSLSVQSFLSHAQAYGATVLNPIFSDSDTDSDLVSMIKILTPSISTVPLIVFTGILETVMKEKKVSSGIIMPFFLKVV
jgi:hypothetical protein